MAKWNFAVAVLACAMFSTPGNAQMLPVSIDGCAQLARIIHAEVSSAMRNGPERAGPWVIESGTAEPSTCATAATTSSRAFAAAMRSAGILVEWSEGAEVCPRAFISQCRPHRRIEPGAFPQVYPDVVASAWDIVARSVMENMFNRHSSDEVRFAENDLRLQIGLRLRTLARN